MEDWIWDAVRQLWSFIAVSLLVYQGGLASKTLAARLGWRAAAGEKPKAWDIWMRIGPLFIGGLFGFLPLPTLDAIDGLTEPSELVIARIGWFMLAGALCGQVYEAARFALTWAKQHFGAPKIDAETAPDPDDPSGGGNSP
jgi:hypothetical protein